MTPEYTEKPCKWKGKKKYPPGEGRQVEERNCFCREERPGYDRNLRLFLQTLLFGAVVRGMPFCVLLLLLRYPFPGGEVPQ